MSNRKKMIAAALMLVVVACAAGCRKKVNPFPQSSAVSGWEKTSETRVFAAKDLWQYIDGDAEHYIQAGVVSTSTSDYKYQGRVEAVVDVFTMKDAAGAQTIFQQNQASDASAISIGDAGLLFSGSLVFRKGPYFVRIVSYQPGADTPQALTALAHGIEARL
ncbi:MAG: hypothetical protein FWD64_11360 [Acidobacteriaceae bacterium]|nr:hypothetical protein [Acidobacteriaceae bacterium]